jgi:hypothetical protein
MHRKRLFLPLFLAVTALILAACTTTPTDALLASQGFGHFNANSISFDLGGGGSSSILTQVVDPTTGAKPVVASGIAQGIGSDIYTVRISASGDPLVTCTNQGGTQAPGQNPAVTVLGDTAIGGDPSNRKGKYEFLVGEDSIDPLDIISSTACPNDNWTARLDFIFWTDIELSLVDPNGLITDTEYYTCDTTLTGITCSRQR